MSPLLIAVLCAVGALVVLGAVLVVGAGALYVSRGRGDIDRTRVRRARTELRVLEQCLEVYRVDKGTYPTSAEGLKPLVNGGYCNATLKDPWGHAYVYVSPGKVHPDGFDVMSYGADGMPGGEGADADIVNE